MFSLGDPQLRRLEQRLQYLCGKQLNESGFFIGELNEPCFDTGKLSEPCFDIGELTSEPYFLIGELSEPCFDMGELQEPCFANVLLHIFSSVICWPLRSPVVSGFSILDRQESLLCSFCAI